MSRETVSVVVLRRDSVRDGTGGYTVAEVPVDGSPLTAWVYRRKPSFQRLDPATGGAGLVVRQPEAVIVSLRDPAAPVEIGDVLVIPPCRFTGKKEVRVTVDHVRHYADSVQCDVETGTTPAAPTP